jgi:hypothetical protein
MKVNNNIIPLWVKPNIFKEKHSYNQRSTLTQNKMLNDCPIISWLANLVYNCWIQPDNKIEPLYKTEENIDKLAQSLWLHSDEKGWYASVFEVVWNYLDTYKFEFESEKDIIKSVQIIKTTKDNLRLIPKLIQLGYAIRVLVWVNKSFFLDGREKWKLENLSNYKGNLNHFLNITKDWILDNYAWYWKYNFYNCNWEEVLSNLVIGNSIYLFVRNI